MKAWFSTLQRRDRNALALAITVVLVFASWHLVLEPLSSGVARLQSRVAQQQDDLDWMRRAAASMTELTRVAPRKLRARAGQSLLSLVDQSARIKGLGKQMRRAEPAGERRVRVSLERARFASLVRWTESLHRDYALVTVDISLDEVDEPGLVNARVTFEDQAVGVTD